VKKERKKTKSTKTTPQKKDTPGTPWKTESGAWKKVKINNHSVKGRRKAERENLFKAAPDGLKMYTPGKWGNKNLISRRRSGKARSQHRAGGSGWSHLRTPPKISTDHETDLENQKNIIRSFPAPGLKVANGRKLHLTRSASNSSQDLVINERVLGRFRPIGEFPVEGGD